MSVQTGHFETEKGPQLAFSTQGVDADGRHETVVVISEDSFGDVTAGQPAFKHKVEQGTDQGQFHS